MTRSIASARPVRQGERPSASNTDRYREAIQALQQLTNQLKVSTPRPWASAMLHSITEIHTDYLVCVRVWRNGTLGTVEVNVAKPQRIRGSETSRAGVTFTGVSADGQTRTASSGPDNEQQQVTPTYLVGDLIEVRVSRGKTGIAEADGQRARLTDRNADGRAWAKVPVP